MKMIRYHVNFGRVSTKDGVPQRQDVLYIVPRMPHFPKLEIEGQFSVPCFVLQVNDMKLIDDTKRVSSGYLLGLIKYMIQNL